MAFAILEKLGIIKPKAYLYSFLYKSNSYLYTTHDLEIVSNNQVFKPISIESSSIKGSYEKARSEVTVDVSRDNEVAKLFRNFLPSGTINLVIQECHVIEPDLTYPLFYGEVTGCEVNGITATLSAQPINVLMNTKTPRYTYQSNCNHFLYQVGCYLNIDDWKFSTTVTNIEQSGQIVTLSLIIPAGSTKDASTYLKAGVLITSNGEYKTIDLVDSVTNKIQLDTPCKLLNVGDIVTVAPGCDLTSNDCVNKFNNFPNFGGFEFVPDRDPFNEI